jgi:2-iminobutanoate/2-iminopropanoate deaminase
LPATDCHSEERSDEESAFLFALNCSRDTCFNVSMRYLTFFLLLATSAFAQIQEHIYIPGERPDLPFSNAVVVGDEIFIAGHIGVDAKTGKPPLKVEDEARAVVEAIKATLAKNDATMEDLVSVTVYCSDLSTYDAFNSVYRGYFKMGKYPARAFIGVSKLLLGARFEIQAIAIKRHH